MVWLGTSICYYFVLFRIFWWGEYGSWMNALFGCLFICFCLRYCNTCCSKKELQDVSSYGMWQTTVMSRWSVKVYTWTFLVSSWIMVGFRSFFFWFVLEFLGEGTNCSWRQPVYLYFLQLNNDASSFLLFATFPYALFFIKCFNFFIPVQGVQYKKILNDFLK